MSLQIPTVLLLQILAHILSDFYLQGQKMAEAKSHKGLQTHWLYVHIVITFFVSWLCSFQRSFWLYSAIIAILHLLIDSLKVRFKRQPYWFFIDQGLHFFVIIVAVFAFNLNFRFNYADENSLFDFLNSPWIPHLLAYSIILKPANIAIRELLIANRIQLPDSQSGLENAGRLIGSVERILAMTLLFLNQYSALGFIIAAKSILRFKETESHKQEYVLIGSLLSFTIALFVTITVRLCT